MEVFRIIAHASLPYEVYSKLSDEELLNHAKTISKRSFPKNENKHHK